MGIVAILFVFFLIASILKFALDDHPAAISNSSSQPINANNPQNIGLPQSAPSQTSEQPTNQPLGPVYNSFWDGSVRQVKQWLKDNLKDPNSFDAIGWTAVQKTPDGGYSVRCKYRAKDSFGGYDISNQIFYMDSEGNVLRYVDVSE
jgi:hypothetical protein